MNVLIKKYLDLNNNSQFKSSFEDLYFSHPNYPSLFSVTDSLDSLGIENIAVKISKEHFNNLPIFFLANYNSEFVLVTKTDLDVKIDFENGTSKNLMISDFLSDWNGIILAIEPKEDETEKFEKKDNSSKIYWSVLLVFIIASFIYFQHSIVEIISVFISLSGIALSILVLQEKYGIHNDVVSKICNGQNTSCNSVIKSQDKKINKWINFSDLPLIFFSSNLIALLLEPLQSTVIIGFASLLSIPILIYSVWLQKIVLKKWCPLCLLISSLILIQSATLYYNFENFGLIKMFNNSYYYFFSIGMVYLIWFFINPLIENKIKSAKKINELIRFKRNFDLFKFLSKPISSIDGLDDLQGINLGNKNANLKIVLLLSPSCGHCHSAFFDAYNLILQHPEKTYVTILFNLNPDNNSNPYLEVVQNLMAIKFQNENQILEAISDWHIKKMNLKDWVKKWGENKINEKVNSQIKLQYDWCLKNEFNYTPVKLINDMIMPNEYDINELHYFINDFNENKNEEKLVLTDTVLN